MICFTSISRRLVPDMTGTFSSEERAQKFHADAAFLPISYLDMGSASDE